VIQKKFWPVPTVEPLPKQKNGGLANQASMVTMLISSQIILAFPRSGTSINCLKNLQISTQHITFHMKFYKRSYSRKRTFTIKRLKSKYNNRRQLISNQLSPSLLQFILVKFKNCLSASACEYYRLKENKTTFLGKTILTDND